VLGGASSAQDVSRGVDGAPGEVVSFDPKDVFL